MIKPYFLPASTPIPALPTAQAANGTLQTLAAASGQNYPAHYTSPVAPPVGDAWAGSMCVCVGGKVYINTTAAGAYGGTWTQLTVP